MMATINAQAYLYLCADSVCTYAKNPATKFQHEYEEKVANENQSSNSLHRAESRILIRR